MHECREIINMRKCELLLANFDTLFQQGVMTMKDEKNMYKEITDYQTLKTHLLRFYQRHDEDGKASIQYVPCKNNPHGRLFSEGPSVQGISRRIRHTICADTMVDLDVKNAHPRLLLRLCMQHGLPHETLEHYIQHRDQVLQEIVDDKFVLTREDAKTLLLRIINGGGKPNLLWSKWLWSFFHDMKTIRHEIATRIHPEKLELAKTIKGEDGFNLEGTAMNYVLCEMERDVLELMIAFCRDEKLPIGALCHDGLMLRKEGEKDYHEIARRLSDHVGLEVVVKDMDEPVDVSYLQMRPIDMTDTKYSMEAVKGFIHQLQECNGSSRVAQYLLSIDDRFRKNYRFQTGKTAKQSLWWELLPDGRWHDNQDVLYLDQHLLETLYNLLTQCMDYTREEMKKCVDDPVKSKALMGQYVMLRSARTSYADKGRKAIWNEFKLALLDRQFGDKIDSHPHLIGFENGVYDLRENRMRCIAPTDYLRKTTHYNLGMRSDPVKRAFLVETLQSMWVPSVALKRSLIAQGREHEEVKVNKLEDQNGMKNYLFTFRALSDCLFGGNRLQKMYVFIGDGKNGKSIVVDLSMKTFGQYAQSIDISSLTKAKRGAHETSDLPKTKGARVVFANESAHNDTLQDHLVKLLTGGDPITCRGLYSDSITFVPQFKLFLSTNHEPSLDRLDGGIARRIQFIHFPFKFFNDEEEAFFDPVKKDKTHFLGQDTGLADKLDACKEEFFLYLLEIYNEIKHWNTIPVPPDFKSYTERYLEEQDALKMFVELNFVPCDKDDLRKMRISRFFDMYRDGIDSKNRKCTSPITLGKEMKRLGYETHRIGEARYFLLRPVDTSTAQILP